MIYPFYALKCVHTATLLRIERHERSLSDAAHVSIVGKRSFISRLATRIVEIFVSIA